MISAGYTHTCGVTQEGHVYCWGDGRRGALGNGRLAVEQLPQRVRSDLAFVDVSAGQDYTCALSTAWALYCWGDARTVPGWPQMAAEPVRVPFARPVRHVAAGRRHACLLDEDGQASCWGWNVDGETGTGAAGTASSMVAGPTPVVTDERFGGLSAGLGFTCGVSKRHTLHCWGSNVSWVVGTGALQLCGEVASVPCAPKPVELVMPGPVASVSAGSGHACIITVLGTLYCWGGNGSGQIGSFGPGVPMVREPTLVTIPRSGRLLEVASGGIHTCARAENRKIYCWGSDALSRVDDTREEDFLPRVAAGGTLFMSVTSGDEHTCALDTKGRALCWGDTIMGALGAQ